MLMLIQASQYMPVRSCRKIPGELGLDFDTLLGKKFTEIKFVPFGVSLDYSIEYEHILKRITC